MKQKLKLALVGAGERGQYCYAPYAKMHGYEIEFVAVADPHKGRREKFVQDYHVPAEGVFETAEQFFARPRMADAVLICTQDSQHYAYACQAIDLGYSILLEKPISPSVRECLDLQRRAEEKGAPEGVELCADLDAHGSASEQAAEQPAGGAVGVLVEERVDAAVDVELAAVQTELADVQALARDDERAGGGGHDNLVFVEAVDVVHAGDDQALAPVELDAVGGSGGKGIVRHSGTS